MQNKEDKIKNFDPNGFSTNNNLFGLPFTKEESEVVIIPVPWEVTVSYAAGTANAPEAILEASSQVDLMDPYIKDAWKIGVYMEPISQEVKAKSDELREKAAFYIEQITSGIDPESGNLKEILNEVNAGSRYLNNWVKTQVLKNLNQGKAVGMVGGDHSTPLGFIEALSEKYESFGILQIDAHADLRQAYEGFEYSHASIMYNALKIKQVSKLVQVGIRDYCEAEANLIKNSNGRIATFFDRDIKHYQYEGRTWKEICLEIISNLPENIYLSFDNDGLDPKLCPNTGTPVSGGFETEQILYLLQLIAESGKKIIGWDLNEVSPGQDEWDANVGARLLYRISNIMAKSLNLAEKLETV